MTSNPIHPDLRRHQTRPEDKLTQLADTEFEAVSHRVGEPALHAHDLHGTLPITAYLDSFRTALESNDVIIICAEPGAGKSTQVPQLFARLGYRVFCTQPTRIAVTSLQKEVERQYGGYDGEIVGYKHGRGELIGQDFTIMFCSDGLLYERVLSERYFQRYNRDNFNDLFIIDECHIFNKNIEHLLALYKKYRAQGLVPKLIIQSATINSDELASFLSVTQHNLEPREIPIFNIPGRQFQIVDLPRGESRLDDILGSIDEGIGHIMDFYPGVGEIERIVGELDSYEHGALVIPLHGKLSAKDQNRVHEPTTGIKYIPTTNVAETSLTIEGVRVVINGGEERVLSVTQDEEILKLEVNSLGTYLQRRGRCGRSGDGYHINWGPPPEDLPDGHWDMQYTSLHGHFLRLIAAGEDPRSLDFLHEPGKQRRWETLEWLRTHGFIDEMGAATPLGQFVAKLPLEPREAMILRYGIEHRDATAELLGCLVDIATILSVRDFRQSSEQSLLELVEPTLHPLMHRSENVANLFGLEVIFREQDPEKRTELFERFGIREAAAEEVKLQREDIANRLHIPIASLGSRNFEAIPSHALLEASAANWSDHIYRYIGRDTKGAALYRKVDEPLSPPRKLNRYAHLGEPPLVTGKPFSIGLTLDIQSERDILRLITQASLIPRAWIASTPELAALEKEVIRYRDMERKNNRVNPTSSPSRGSENIARRHDKRRR